MGSIDGTSSEDEKFIVPYERNLHFKGRSDLLAKLYDKLFESIPDQYNHRVALHGLGGVGKTQLALEYAHQHWKKQTYERVFWVSADSQAALLADLQKIGARAHCVSNIKDLNPLDIAVRVFRWLNKQEKLLFVLDNLDDMSVIDEVDGCLLDMAPRRHMLITTRNEHCDDIPAKGLNVQVLEVSNAAELLLTRSQVDTGGEAQEAILKAAEEIVTELGCLPLAIEQAAAYIREASHDILQFLPSYRKNRKYHHKRTPRRSRMYSKSLATTWSMSFQQAQENNEGAAHLLKLLAFLNPDGVLIDFLEAGKESLTPELRELVADRTRLYDALAELTRFSLVGRHDEVSPHITIHRLVQSIIQDDMSSSEFDAMTAMVLGLCDSAFPISVSGRWETVELRQLGRAYQKQVIVPLRVMGQRTSETLWKLLLRLGTFLKHDGNYQIANEFLAKALEITTSLNGVAHSDTLCVAAELAATSRYQGRWEDAQRLQERALELRKKLLGQEHPDTLGAMTNLANTYGDQGRWEDARRLQERALELSEKLLGQEHPDTLGAMANLASTYGDQGRWEDAWRLQERALELREKLLEQEHPDTLFAMTNLGILYRKLGMISRSIGLLETAVHKQAEKFGTEHPTTLWTKFSLATSYEADGKLDDAIALFESTLESQKRVIGEQHPESKNTAAWLESAYRRRRESMS